MSRSADRALAERDRALPGLGVLLDADAFGAALQAALPSLAISQISANYVRYKPGTRCLVAYELETPGARLRIHAVAHGGDVATKVAKLASVAANDAPLRQPLLLPGLQTVVRAFPDDARLRSLGRVVVPESRARLLRRAAAPQPALWSADLEVLSYKPERRLVARLEGSRGARAVLRLYRDADFARARAAARSLESREVLRVPVAIDHSHTHRVLTFSWLTGEPLRRRLAAGAATESRRVGRALAELHGQAPPRKVVATPSSGERLRAVAAAVEAILPEAGARASRSATRLASALAGFASPVCAIHGDFHADQVLVGGDAVPVLDLDEVRAGTAAEDLGCFLAHLERDAICGELPNGSIDAIRDGLLAGYADLTRPPDFESLARHTAAALLALSPEPFRARVPEWAARTTAILERVESISRGAPAQGARPGRAAPAAVDVALPMLGEALDPEAAAEHLSRALGVPEVTVASAKLLRHKPGRRCLVEYALSEPAGWIALGKMRARGADVRTDAVQRLLYQGRFGPDAEDAIRVPEPLGVAPALRMTLQRRVPGSPLTEHLWTPEGPALVRRAVEAAHKLHTQGVSIDREHGRADEMRVLRKRLPAVSAAHPGWERRIRRLLEACEQLAARIDDSARCGVHRDFYADQLVVTDGDITLVDLDLYCMGSPALDIGNFLAHLTELALRRTGDPDGLVACEESMTGRFLELAGSYHAEAVAAYQTLTLARHVALSTHLDGRGNTTAPLLELCEERLGLAADPARAGRAAGGSR